MRKSPFLLIIIAAAAFCHSAMSIDIIELITWETMYNGSSVDGINGLAIDGQTAYVQLCNGGAAYILRVENLDGTQTTTELVSAATWFAASGLTKMASGKGFQVYSVSNYVQFGDTSSIGNDEIWRVDTSSGLLTRYVSKQSIMDVTGAGGVMLQNPQCINPTTGEHVFYDGSSDSILITTGSNAVQILISDDELTNAFGTDTIDGGMAYDADGNLYFGTRVSATGYTAIHKCTPAGVLSDILTNEQILSVCGPDYVVPTDLYFASNGWMYLDMRTGQRNCIMKFDPADPPGTLEVFLSEHVLSNSVVSNAYVGSMDWYGSLPNHGLTWQRNGEHGIYNAIPEPAAVGFAVLAIWSAFINRKRDTSSS